MSTYRDTGIFTQIVEDKTTVKSMPVLGDLRYLYWNLKFVLGIGNISLPS